MIDISRLTIHKAHEDLTAGAYTARDLLRAYRDAIAERDGAIHAYLEVFDDGEAQAAEADTRIAEGRAGTLTGIPFAIKDNILIEGHIASSASKILEGYVASYDAEVIRRLKEAGAVLVGRTNMDEFAMGGSTENSAFGPTMNPHDVQRVPGGSSGGSAAAVAGHMALAALGSDTGGSIRQPAAFCGVVGLKPTYGSVSRRGVMAMGSSLDQIGPIGKTVADVEAIYRVIAGHDPLDSTSYPDHEAPKKKKVRTIGIPKDALGEGVDPDVAAAFTETIDALTNMGYRAKEISLPHMPYALASYYVIMPAESSTNLARYDGKRYGLSVEGDTLLADYMQTRAAGFGAEVRRRIMLGTYVLSAGYYDAYYNKAAAVRALIRKDFEKAFEDVDVIATPTSPVPAFLLGERTHDPVQMYRADTFTVPANLIGAPALSVPSGKVMRDGTTLPVGFQIIAPHFEEHALFAVGQDVEAMEA